MARRPWLTAVLCATLLSGGIVVLASILFPSFPGNPFLFLLGLAGFTAWLLKSVPKKIWGMTLLGLSLESFALPLAFLWTFIRHLTPNKGLDAIGALLVGGILLSFFALVGLLAGLLFLVLGWLVLRSASAQRRKHKGADPRIP